MNISPYVFEKAEEGSLFIKKNNNLVPVSFDELSKPIKKEFAKMTELDFKVSVISKCLSNFEKLAKRHFIVVFNLFATKVYNGELEIEDDELLKLDEKVLNNELSVEDALNKHEYLKETFDLLYGEEFDNLQKLGGK